MGYAVLHWGNSPLRFKGKMEKMSQADRQEMNRRLKYGPKLSRNELVKYLLRIYEGKIKCQPQK